MSPEGPSPALPAYADMFARIVESRYSCRAFRPNPIPQTDLEQIFTMAQRAPSGTNSQPWQVYLFSGEPLARLSEALTAHVLHSDGRLTSDIGEPPLVEGVHLDRRRQAGFALYDAVGVDRKDRRGRQRQTMENYRFFGAPHVAIIVAPRGFGMHGAIDCGAYLATLLLAATSLGIASIAQGAIALQARFIREWLDLDEEWSVVCGVSLGYAEDKHPVNSFRTPRARLDEVIIGQVPGSGVALRSPS